MIRISKLSWVGCNREIYWNKHKVNQGRNKIINTCRKILTVSPSIPIEILLSVLQKVIEIPDDLSADVLEILIQAIDDFELHNAWFQEVTISHQVNSAIQTRK